MRWNLRPYSLDPLIRHLTDYLSTGLRPQLNWTERLATDQVLVVRPTTGGGQSSRAYGIERLVNQG